MEREEARGQHLLMRPAELEEVVGCLQPLLHFHVALVDDAVEAAVDRPNTLDVDSGRWCGASSHDGGIGVSTR